MNLYLILKSLHIVAVISWMAGLLYLPRLFVYHSNALKNLELSETFIIMEYKLFNYIMTPAMMIVWMSGLSLAFITDSYQDHWLQAKFLLVVLLTGAHALFGHHVSRFAISKNQNSQSYFRLLNEVPTVLMIVIVVLVVAKPF